MVELKKISENDFKNSIRINSPIYFIDNEFNFEINFTYEIASLAFYNCLFKENFTISNFRISGEIKFENCVFEKKVSFKSFRFPKKAIFIKSLFKAEVDFSNVFFTNVADFTNAEFYFNTIFLNTYFDGNAIFTNTCFKNNVLFTYATINKDLIIRNSIFEKGLDLSSAIIIGNIILFNNILNCNHSVKTVRSKEYENFITSKGIITYENERETFRILKNQLNKQGNNIEALVYSSYEKDIFYKELKQKLSVKLSIRTLEDFLINQFNIWSNKNGKSWFTGVGFTLTLGFIFFYLSVIATETYIIGIPILNIKDFTELVKLYFVTLIPIHNIDYMEKFRPNFIFYLIDFFGRAFVSYGIYQTIQAFRKFKVV